MIIDPDKKTPMKPIIKPIKDLDRLKWIVFGIVVVIAIVFEFIFRLQTQIKTWEAMIDGAVILLLSYLLLYFTFKEIEKREQKLKNTMKELFSSYQYIGNVNRQLDTLTNLNKYITKADFTEEEIITFVVNTCGRLAEADYCAVFLKDKNGKFKKIKIYYYQDRATFESINSHLKCEQCREYISTNEFILEVNKFSEKKCEKFPKNFWDTYTMLCFPIVFKGQKKGFMAIIHNNKVKISHLNFRVMSSLVAQLGSVIK